MSKKPPYFKKYTTIGKIDIWIVDGNFVRRNLDEEFTNFGQHYRFKCIPKNEFWIDKEYSPGEEIFFIDHLLIENKLMKEGSSYKKAITVADEWERKERLKSKLGEKLLELKKRNDPKIYDKIHKKKLNGFSTKDLTVWIVDGEAVRDIFYIDFTCGGHDFVYHFVPKGEIWLDDDFSAKERKFILLHELFERNLMSKGSNYPKAHAKASQIEYYCRHFPKQLKEKIDEQWKLNSSKKYADQRV